MSIHNTTSRFNLTGVDLRWSGGADFAHRILTACERYGLILKQSAYTLATAIHESNLGKNMVEFATGDAYEGREDLGNIYPGDGRRFKGRGLVQITGRANYTYWGKRLDKPLVAQPELAADPEIAIKILVLGMRDGTFTGVGLERFINEGKTDYRNARKIVNGLDRADHIAGIARQVEAALKSGNGTGGGPASLSVLQIQAALVECGWRTTVDGDRGPQTALHTEQFQAAYAKGEALHVDGIVGPLSAAALTRCAGEEGALSKNFRAAEFAATDNGMINIKRQLVLACQATRDYAGHPIEIVSGSRTIEHNRRVGGVSNSQHLVGRAVDIKLYQRLSVAAVKGLRVWTGIGDRNGLMLHGDVKVGGSVINPRRWAS